MRAARPMAIRLAGPLVAAALVAGCGGSNGPAQVDVEPTVTLPDSVAMGEPLSFVYTWSPSDEFNAPMNDYRVFVHLVDPQGRILLQDDHYPPEPTSQWRAGEPQTYQRWVYPPDLEVEYVDVVVGLYTEDQRAQVRDGSAWADSVSAQRMSIRVEDQTGDPVYMTGWHDEERVDDSLLGAWRWSQDVGQLVFTNPRRDAVLHLRAHGPIDELQGPQSVVVKVHEQEVARFEIVNADPILERIELAADTLGDSDWVEIAIEVNPVLVPQELDPSSADVRRLGLQVFQLFLSSS